MIVSDLKLSIAAIKSSIQLTRDFLPSTNSKLKSDHLKHQSLERPMNEHLINTARLTDELIVHSGVDYKSFMQSIITYFEAERYFEIGTQNGVSLSMMPCDSIAVDP